MATIMRKVNILSRAEGVFRNDMLKDSSLSPCHHSYILAISKNPGMTQDELAGHICVNKSGVTRTLAQLEGLGYVERRVCEADKRVMRVYPTELMLEVLPRVVDIVHLWNDYLNEALTEDEAETLSRLLDKVSSRARDYVITRERKPL